MATDASATDGHGQAAIRLPPLVAVITRTDDGAGLEQTARSLQAQSLVRWHWSVVAADKPAAASTLGLAGDDPRIAVVSAPDLAEATVVVRLEPGDELEPTALEKWAWTLEAHPDWAFADAQSVDVSDPDGVPVPSASSRAALVAPEIALVRAAVRRDVWDEVGGNHSGAGDLLGRWEFWFRVAKLRRWGGTIPELLVHRRPESVAVGQTSTAADQLRIRYPRLWRGDRPGLAADISTPNEWLPDTLPFENPQKPGRRLLLVVPWLDLGGADKFNLDLIRYLCHDNWSVTVASTLAGGSTWRDEFTSLTPDVFELPEFLPRREHPRFLRYLIGSRGIDTVLVANSEFGYRVLPYLRAHFPKRTFVDYCHSDSPDWNHGGYPRFSVEYQDQLDLTIVSCEYLRRWMADRGADESRIETCYVGVDASQFAPTPARRVEVRKRLGIAPEKQVALFVGRLSADKQPHVLGRAADAIVKQNRNAVVLVVGDGPELPWLKGYVSTHGVDEQVMLLGSVAHGELAGLFDASDVFFLPSRWEGIALTAYEAMAAALPAIVADVGGQRELVTSECGVLVQRSNEPAEARAYATAVLALLRDDARRAAMGRAARERVQRDFRLDAMGPRMVELLELAAAYAERQPRQAPTLGLGRACAAAAVEYARVVDNMSMSTAGLFLREGLGGARRRVAFAALRLGSLVYRWGLAHGMTWMAHPRNRIRRALLRAGG